MTFPKRHFYGILCFFVCISLAGCAKEIRQLEDALWSVTREPIEILGASHKRCSLVRLRASGQYAVVVPPKHIIHLDKQYVSARVVKQFSERDRDYAIIECSRENGSLLNMLVVIPAAAQQATLYTLNSTSNNPFGTETAQNRILLYQDADRQNQLHVWFLEDAGLRGPTPVPRARLAALARGDTATPRPGQPRTQTAPPPVIVPEASAQLDKEQVGTSVPAKAKEQQNNSAPTTPPPPVVVIDSPPSAPVPVVVIDSPPSPPAPVIVIDRQPAAPPSAIVIDRSPSSESKTVEKPTEQ